jgi:hypothetical protein
MYKKKEEGRRSVRSSSSFNSECDAMIEYLELEWPDAELAGWSGPGWYFWSETGSHCTGPFKTEEEARSAEKDYGEQL